MPIPVIDLFSGPGGLGEGFASLDGGNAFRIVASAEMDSSAHETLRLRSYFRRIRGDQKWSAPYYGFCNGILERPWNSLTEAAWHEAGEEARCLTLGEHASNKELDELLDQQLKNATDCVLIGGPPCQAYSLVGRARNKGIRGYSAEADHRHFLYQEYLRIIRRYCPAIFVMENVKGILSSRVGGAKIFHQILADLSAPAIAITGKRGAKAARYRIHSLVSDTVFEPEMDPESIDPASFVIRSELYGIPQTRHRVILVGVREDIEADLSKLQPAPLLTVEDAISDLPRIRSRLSRTPDIPGAWARAVRSHLIELAADAMKSGQIALANRLSSGASRIDGDLTTGALRCVEPRVQHPQHESLREWYRDPFLSATLNHESRGHMSSDLRRYGYAAVFAEEFQCSPKGPSQFSLSGLRPDHANWETGNFSDRFRVQVKGRPASTITSHISKDGHYFIHPDVSQCRSLTVREAARLQTFPDNYLFCGNRTQQFHQVGNAVPPLLARKIALAVKSALDRPCGRASK